MGPFNAPNHIVNKEQILGVRYLAPKCVALVRPPPNPCTSTRALCSTQYCTLLVQVLVDERLSNTQPHYCGHLKPTPGVPCGLAAGSQKGPIPDPRHSLTLSKPSLGEKSDNTK